MERLLFEIVTPLSGNTIFTQYNATSFWIQTSSVTLAWTGSPYFTTGSRVHVAAVFSNTTTCTTYYNGNLANTNSAFTTLPSTAGTYKFNLGWAATQATTWGNPAYSGCVDQFLIYNTALNAAQINNIAINNNTRF